MNAEPIFDSCWSAIEDGCKIWDVLYSDVGVSFRITRKYFMGQMRSYFVQLEKSPSEFNEKLLCTVTFIDPVSKKNMTCQKELHRHYFMSVLSAHPDFNIILLYFTGILSFEIDKKRFLSTF